jgi:hypothetical protein
MKGMSMRPSKLNLVTPICLLVVSACQVYPQWNGNYNAGPVDPVNYPPAYLGKDGDRLRPGRGTFTAVAARAGADTLSYYSFPFSTAALATGSNKPDPLALLVAGAPNAAVPAPIVEIFDGKPGENPFPSQVCTPPDNDGYDPRLDDVRMDEQSPVFSVLPQATYSPTAQATTSYAPVVAEKIYSNTGKCQQFRAVETPPPAVTDGSGYYLAWALIDPGAGVYRVGETKNNATGLGVQHWGWFNNFIVAFIDGGYVPTRNDAAMDGSTVVRMVTQRLYYPRSKITTGKSEANGAIGLGYDVLEAKRGNPGYSPVCEVFTYDAGGARAPGDLPRDADTIVATYGNTLQAANPPYVFCLQAE